MARWGEDIGQANRPPPDRAPDTQFSFWYECAARNAESGGCRLFSLLASGGFMSQQCQQLLTGPHLSQGPHKTNQASPTLKGKVAPTRLKGLKGPRPINMRDFFFSHFNGHQ